jgi:hypothetical protein
VDEAAETGTAGRRRHWPFGSSHLAEGFMRGNRLPKRVPVGTKYVIEGKSLGGKEEMQISARYLVFPDGRCFDLPSDLEEFVPTAPTAAGKQTSH